MAYEPCTPFTSTESHAPRTSDSSRIPRTTHRLPATLAPVTPLHARPHTDHYVRFYDNFDLIATCLMNFFYLLSGFVMTLGYGEKQFPALDYFVKRFARIAPMYYLSNIPMLFAGIYFYHNQHDVTMMGLYMGLTFTTTFTFARCAALTRHYAISGGTQPLHTRFRATMMFTAFPAANSTAARARVCGGYLRTRTPPAALADAPWNDVTWTIQVFVVCYACYPCIAPLLRKLPLSSMRAWALISYIVYLILALLAFAGLPAKAGWDGGGEPGLAFGASYNVAFVNVPVFVMGCCA
eukprot:1859567-Prymnesium_polylepis.1